MNVYHLSVFLHILFAAFWVGGMLFLPLVLLPAIKNHPDRRALLHATGLKFQLYGWIVLAGLVCTGLSNAWLRGIPFTWNFYFSNNYGILMGIKLILFTLILLLSGVHDFVFGIKATDDKQPEPSARLVGFARWSGRIMLLVSLVMVWLGVVLSRGGG